MQKISRREMVAAAGGLLLGSAPAALRGASPNSEVRLAVIGLGGIDIPGSVGGRGRQLISRLREVPGARVVALCDVDETVLGHSVEQFQKRGEQVAAHVDMRRVFDDRNVDGVLIATPNHWHALATVWACQAGKDVYVEKPFSHNIWEGRQMVAAARKHDRMVQVGTQRRSSDVLGQACNTLHGGALGPIRCVHAIVYRKRPGISRVNGPTPIPASVDYDLWCGPVAKSPLHRQQLHYEWHWFWSTGDGEIGNNGAHLIDIARWALGQNAPPPRALSIGGRFGVDDVAETPNTQIAFLDYQPAPLICEVRNLGFRGQAGIGAFRGTDRGLVIDCEGGHCLADSSGATLFDKQGQKIREIPATRQARELGARHVANFVEAVRDRDRRKLKAEAMEGHNSTICSQMANISHRLGQLHEPAAIREMISGNARLSDAFERCGEHLAANGVDLDKSPAVLGPWVTLDADQERFVGDLSSQANRLSRPVYRAPFRVPTITPVS